MCCYDAILPADGRIAGEFAKTVGTTIKALIPWQNRTLLGHTIHILQAEPRIRRIVVVGPKEVAKEAANYAIEAVLPPASSAPQNIGLGIRWLQQLAQGPSKRLLLLTTDLPFLTPQVLAAFLNASPADADIVVPVVNRTDFEARFPNSAATFVHLQDGYWTVGCAFLISTEAFLRIQPLIESLFATRKSQIRTALLVGPELAFRFFTHRLSIYSIVQRAEKILQCKPYALHNAPPEIAYDVDTLLEYKKALSYPYREEFR